MMPIMWPCDHLDSVDSTQQEAFRRLSAQGPGADRPFALWSTAQTRGQGRSGRPWVDCGHALALSVAWPQTNENVSHQAWPLRISLITAETIGALWPQAQSALGVKWPNDLMIRDAKAGGVLVSRHQAHGRWWLVAGIGVNLRWTLTPPADRKVADLAQIGISGIDAGALADRLVLAIEAEVNLSDLAAQKKLIHRFSALDVYANQPVVVRDPASERVFAQGLNRGVSEAGEILIEQMGVLHRIALGELSLRPHSQAAS